MFIKNNSLSYFYLFLFILVSQAHAQGLIGTYYGTRNFDGPPLITRTDSQISFEWMNTAPDPAMMADNFSVRWQGTITVNATGNYTIGLRSDDGCRVWIDDKLVVDAWKETGPTFFSGSVRLVSGRATSIMVEYFEATGGAVATLMAGLEGQAPVTVSADWLTPDIILPQGLPKVGVFSNDRRATEGRDRLSFTVYRIGGLGTPLTARLSLGDQVQAGVDFVPFSTDVTIPANLSAVSINVTPINNDIFNGLRTIDLLVNPSDTYARITDQPLVLEIVDDEREVPVAYTIAGEINSDIPMTGNFVLEVTPVINGELDITQQNIFTFVPSVSYSTPRLPANEYELWGFADSNENGRRDMDEPQGFWADGSVRTRVTLPPDRFDAHIRFKFLLDMSIPMDQNLSDEGLESDQNAGDMDTQVLVDAHINPNDMMLSADLEIQDKNIAVDQNLNDQNPNDQNNTESTTQPSSGCQQDQHTHLGLLLIALITMFISLFQFFTHRLR